MRSRTFTLFGKSTVAALAIVGWTAHAVNAGSGPLQPLAGTWSGDGRVTLSDGQVERIRCRAEDEVGEAGGTMQQHLRCASPSYNFEVQNNVVARDGRLSGSWNELTNNIAGEITGTASRALVRARVEGGAFAADVTLAARGNSMRVTLDPQGSQVREVAVMLRRT
jgi:hypothetical protein